MVSPKVLLLQAAAALLPALALSLAQPALRAEVFRDRAADWGLSFEYFNGMTGQLYFAEMTGGGAALLDYDRDGDLDVFFVQGGMLGPHGMEEVLVPPRHEPPDAPRLYRNDTFVGPAGEPVLRFTDVTREAGLRGRGYGMGVASGDYDGDGWVDLYVTALGPNSLLRNEGDGTFRDVTEAAGVDDTRWSVPAVFFDADGDRDLDLYVGNYVEFRVATHKTCASPAGARDYCGPSAYPPETDRLFLNRGDGTFADATAAAGLGSAAGPALGAVSADFDGDGRADLYVANDGADNFLWLNQGGGRFEDGALLAGCAVSGQGEPQASMGVVAGDLDADGDDDLFMTHLARETNTVYLNDGTGLFEDRSRESGLGAPSFPYTGFGTALLDYDNDGVADLFVANGEVKIIEEQLRAGAVYPLAQPNLLFRGLGGGRFADATAEGGEVLAALEVSRGAAAGDLDLDGDADLVVVNSAAPARLLDNRVGQEGAWLSLLPRDAAGGPAHDAKVTASGEGFVGHGRVRTDGSYASASDPRILLGWGDRGAPSRVVVRWPGGPVRAYRDPPLRRHLELPRVP